jgi:hypothetical protein
VTKISTVSTPEASWDRKSSKTRRSGAVDVYKLRSIGSSPQMIVEDGIDRKKYL